MAVVQLRNLEIGTGIPKICVPIPCRTKTEVRQAAERIAGSDAVDMVEWRADWYEEGLSGEEMLSVGRMLREILGEKPVLFTWRTEEEGGAAAAHLSDREAYVRLNLEAARTGMFDLVDVELSAGEGAVKQVLDTAHENGVKVIVSSHDFVKTPGKAEIVGRLRVMQDLGADLPKVAVMPENNEDVLTLLDATREMAYNFADRPLITMSMGEMGTLSRLLGEIYGSAVTFGTMGASSAPGQMDAAELKEMLLLIHDSQGNLI